MVLFISLKELTNQIEHNGVKGAMKDVKQCCDFQIQSTISRFLRIVWLRYAEIIHSNWFKIVYFRSFQQKIY